MNGWRRSRRQPCSAKWADGSPMAWCLRRMYLLRIWISCSGAIFDFGCLCVCSRFLPPSLGCSLFRVYSTLVSFPVYMFDSEVREKIATRRVNLKPRFQDYDSLRHFYIPKNRCVSLVLGREKLSCSNIHVRARSPLQVYECTTKRVFGDGPTGAGAALQSLRRAEREGQRELCQVYGGYQCVGGVMM